MDVNKKNQTLKKLAVAALVSVAVCVCTVFAAASWLLAYPKSECETVEIPSFVGQRYADLAPIAKIRLEEEPAFSDTVPMGVVMAQSPSAGALRKLTGEEYLVRVTVSLGRETCEIPDVRGFLYPPAAAALRSAGARIRIVPVYDDKRSQDTVLDTSPKAGERIERGEQVTLFVSRRRVHRSVCVPDLAGKRLEDATFLALSDGLTLGKLAYEHSDDYEKGTVIDQSIGAGHYVLYGSPIDLVISLGEIQEEKHPFGRYIPDN